MTKEQRIISERNRKLAVEYFKAQGIDMTDKVLHHVLPCWRHYNVEQYIKWDVRDLIPLTKSEHMRIHRYSWDYKYTDETRAKMSKSHIGEVHSEERRRHNSENQKGQKWYNNGEVQTKSYSCPEGYVPGMLPKKHK